MAASNSRAAATEKPAGSVPTTWQGQAAVVLKGTETVEKTELRGKPFAVLAVKNTVNDQGIGITWLEGKFAPTDDRAFTFTDAGKGIREQVIEHLKTLGKADVLDEWIELDPVIFCPLGLRPSTFDKDIPNNRGVMETKKVTTWYLTTTGERV